MPEPRPSPNERRPTMRSLRAGRPLRERPSGPTPAPSGPGRGPAPGPGAAAVAADEDAANAVADETPIGGPIPDEAALADLLGRTISSAVDSGGSVLVFRLRCTPVRVQQWSDYSPAADEDFADAIESLVGELDPTIVYHRVGCGELIGFSTSPLSAQTAGRAGGRLAAGLTRALGGPGREYLVSPRVGVAIVDRDDGPGPAIEAAVRTLSQTSSESPFLVHNDFIGQRCERAERAYDELKGDLVDGPITFEFQPRITTVGHRVAGLEVLSRWHHHARGPIPAIEFLRVAERSGLLVDLGHRVRRSAVTIAAGWHRNSGLAAHRLWLNVTPVELCHEDFVGSITDLLAEHPGVAIGLEIPDSPVLQDAAFASTFDRLQELGVALALDNVRVSTLSLGRIQHLPVSMINLDGRLVRRLPTDAAARDLVRFLVRWCAASGAVVTACEVETDEQLARAGDLGVHQVQGLALYEPLSLERAGELLARDGRGHVGGDSG